jgi:hypothetical protein
LIFASKYQEEPRTKDLLIIGCQGFRDYFEGLRGVHGSWVKPQTFRLHIREVVADEVVINDLRATTRPLDHARESVGYRLTSVQGKTLV